MSILIGLGAFLGSAVLCLCVYEFCISPKHPEMTSCFSRAFWQCRKEPWGLVEGVEKSNNV